MLSLLELERAARVLDAGWCGARVDRVVAPGDFELVLHLAGGEQREAKDRLFMLHCWRPVFARVAALPGARPAPATPPALAQVLKPRLEGTRLREASLRGGDRQLLLAFDARDATAALANRGAAATIAVFEVWRTTAATTADPDRARNLARAHVRLNLDPAGAAASLTRLAEACHGDDRPDCPILDDLAGDGGP